jgi:Protein of unknown function (DUF2442)
MSQIHDIVEVEVLPPYGLRVTFDDGEVREVDLSAELDGAVFEPLRDPARFAEVRVDSETGTVAWPTGADLDPIVLYRGLPPLNAVKVETADRT